MPDDTKKITLTVQELIAAKNTLDQLLSLQGIDYKKVYWLDRCRKSIYDKLKPWIKFQSEVYEKYAIIQLDDRKFISWHEYTNFKKEFLTIFSSFKDSKISDIIYNIDLVFDKYETNYSSASVKVIPAENQSIYFEELEKKAKSIDPIEIDYWIVEVDKMFDEVLKQLPGNSLIAIEFILKMAETSNLILH